MGSYQNTGALWEYYLIYLRKSRQDDPNETVEEVLSKHERDLQELALRELGGHIPEGNIYREIASSESIEGRAELQKLLARIESPEIRGVLVVDPPRLSRGDLEDCGRIISEFRYTNTIIITLRDRFDLSTKRDRKYFQDEIIRGSDYLEYTKEVLWRGRENAVKRGCFIMQNAPYGYDKIKIGKDHTLEPNDKADVVRMIFEWYALEWMSIYSIAKKLDDMGIPAQKGGKWHKEVISRMLRNPHYIGKVVCGVRPTTMVIENGERKKKRSKAPEEEWIVAEGKHPAIIDQDLWDKAQERAKDAPRHRSDKSLVNVLAGILRCSNCGYIMDRLPQPSGARYCCPPRSGKQCFKSVKCDVLLTELRFFLETVELPKLKSKVENDEGNARKIQERILERLNKQMSEYREQEEHQYELLETRKYTQEVFDRRNAALRAKMEECKKQMYHAKSALPKAVDYGKKVKDLEKAIAALNNPKLSVNEVNRALKIILERIEFTGEPSLGKYGPRASEEFKLKIILRL